MIHQKERVGFFLFPRYFWLLLLLIPLVSISAQPIPSSAETPAQSAAEIDYPPFSFVDKNGRVEGFSIELMRSALEAMNREVSFRTGAWAEVRSWLEQGTVQALPLVGCTPERETLFDFTFSYMTLHGAIVVREDNEAIEDISDLTGHQVAVMKGDNAEEIKALGRLAGGVAHDYNNMLTVILGNTQLIDAISEVGMITIETENVVLDETYSADRAGFLPGDYVMLAVSDNGSGMDKKTVDNAFDPFFTTKETGMGTGLGLSTVYGIVKQNHGFINIYSESGRGTSIKIYFPRHRNGGEAEFKTMDVEIAMGDGENIFVVEDEDAVLRLTQQMLEAMGYEVLTSATPAEALKTARRQNKNIELLITDVVLPGKSGKDLAAEITKIRPGIKVLFMSGYPADVIAHQGVLDEGVAFIEKPFTFQRLTTKVKEALGTR